MKKTITLLIFVLTISINYSQESKTSEINKAQLIEFIKESIVANKVANNPLVVLDEQIILNVDDLTDDQKFFGRLSIIEKGNKEMTDIYGEKAINGIILIESLPESPDGKNVEISNGKVLFFIGNKEIPETELNKLDPNSILNVQVIKTKEEVLKHTDKKCDGIVIITLKS
ncbi:hypothetical protein [Aequorivita viscosa]|uniref:TonB-dependent Receptor Plug Domain n=1 Tax=Aequorivita viscosa TaxID=797419 RepID=A0A1M6A8P5_9FLAO|nr:hypothetical protein [Aequorivita viscosa]SDW12972.1 hypothetical protein SAMN05216556_102111 [Aequorivita viscosa]SHI32817.1 hypothetical protein SAMN04487908_101110 [Aequorivita viscosa]